MTRRPTPSNLPPFFSTNSYNSVFVSICVGGAFSAGGVVQSVQPGKTPFPPHTPQTSVLLPKQSQNPFSKSTPGPSHIPQSSFLEGPPQTP